MNSIPPVTINAEIQIPAEQPLTIKEFKDQYEAQAFALKHNGYIGPYADGRWFVVYEKGTK